jgi:hypothetical protein
MPYGRWVLHLKLEPKLYKLKNILMYRHIGAIHLKRSFDKIAKIQSAPMEPEGRNRQV